MLKSPQTPRPILGGPGPRSANFNANVEDGPAWGGEGVQASLASRPPGPAFRGYPEESSHYWDDNRLSSQAFRPENGKLGAATARARGIRLPYTLPSQSGYSPTRVLIPIKLSEIVKIEL